MVSGGLVRGKQSSKKLVGGPTGMVSGSCARCHSARGFIEFSENFTDAEWEAGVVEPQVHSCAVCHDPHGNGNPAQLRVYGTTLVPATVDGESSWAEVSGLGASATCISCHNGSRALTRGRPVISIWSLRPEL